jgi:hypothetical protein
MATFRLRGQGRGDRRRRENSGCRVEGRDRLQQLFAMAKRRDADLLEIVAG